MKRFLIPEGVPTIMNMLKRVDKPHVFYVRELNDFLSPILLTVPLQLLAYNMARHRGMQL
jgi:glucosamine 6-phosphate synthetase-like amidotransferase/phosphosugar isomerase protein